MTKRFAGRGPAMTDPPAPSLRASVTARTCLCEDLSLRGVFLNDEASAPKRRSSLSDDQRHSLVLTILRWYRLNGRKLPWRGIRNPYRILVSEIMLQQTQVSRVLEKYPTFLKAFPTFHSLAGAQRATVIRTWQGMGYNNRAVRLHVLAQLVVDQHKGRLPREYEMLRTLPGIGQYTARAILSSAFGMAEPVVDVNVRRLFSRLFWNMPDTSAMRPEAEIWKLATGFLPHHAAYDWNQALMDLGATVCTARAPRCTACPVARFCMSRKRMQQPSGLDYGRASSKLKPSRGAPQRGVPIMGGSQGGGPRRGGPQRGGPLRGGPRKGGPRKGGPHRGKSGKAEQRRGEPSYRGIPTRIHRGRIVEALRHLPDGSWIGISALTKRLFGTSTKDDVNWLETVVRVLERDGLVRIEPRRTTIRVSLQ